MCSSHIQSVEGGEIQQSNVYEVLRKAEISYFGIIAYKELSTN